MRILVCIKQVPGTTAVEVDAETGVLKRVGVATKLNPYDLYALEAALQLKEQMNAEVCALTMGPPQAEAVLREALMMGVDQVALLSDAALAGADVLATARALSESAKKLGAFDIVFCGKQTTDGDTAQVGPELAEFLGIPHIANVGEVLAATEESVDVSVDFPQTVFSLSITYPCLLTMEKGSNSPRLPSYRRQLLTAEWPIQRLTLADFADSDPAHYGLRGSPTQVERIFPPAAKQENQLWQGTTEELVQQVVALLHERKIIDVAIAKTAVHGEVE